MKKIDLLAHFEVAAIPLGCQYPSVLVVPRKAKADSQTVYVLDLPRRQSIRVEVNLEFHAEQFFASTERLKQQLGIDCCLYPFGLSKQMYTEFCITPHSFLCMGHGLILCGLELFNRYEILDLNRHSVGLLDPGVDDDWLTASPSYDDAENLHFGSTALVETIKAILEPDRQSFTRFWKLDKNDQLTETWQGKSGALLHQMKVVGVFDSPEAEVRRTPRIVYINKDGSPAAGHVEGGAYVNFTNLKTGIVYKVGPFDVPAHTEVDPVNQNVVYLTEHNFRIESGQPVILGNAAVFKFELGETGPRYLGKFTHRELYRMTSLELFRKQQATYMALTGYPDTIFVVNADTLELVHKIKFRSGTKVDLSKGPFACKEPNYGLQVSPDGTSLFTIESDVFKAFDLETGSLKDEYAFSRPDDPEFSGHSYSFQR